MAVKIGCKVVIGIKDDRSVGNNTREVLLH